MVWPTLLEVVRENENLTMALEGKVTFSNKRSRQDCTCKAARREAIIERMGEWRWREARRNSRGN